jgi:hypothetical protein
LCQTFGFFGSLLATSTDKTAKLSRAEEDFTVGRSIQLEREVNFPALAAPSFGMLTTGCRNHCER